MTKPMYDLEPKVPRLTIDTESICGAILEATTIPNPHQRMAEVERLVDKLIKRVEGDMRLRIAVALNDV